MIRIPYVAALYERIPVSGVSRIWDIGKKIRDFLLTGRVVCGYCNGRSMA